LRDKDAARWQSQPRPPSLLPGLCRLFRQGAGARRMPAPSNSTNCHQTVSLLLGVGYLHMNFQLLVGLGQEIDSCQAAMLSICGRSQGGSSARPPLGRDNESRARMLVRAPVKGPFRYLVLRAVKPRCFARRCVSLQVERVLGEWLV
jgi:hypothetical protein